MWSTGEVMLAIVLAASFGACLGLVVAALLFVAREDRYGSRDSFSE